MAKKTASKRQAAPTGAAEERKPYVVDAFAFRYRGAIMAGGVRFAGLPSELAEAEARGEVSPDVPRPSGREPQPLPRG